VGALIPRLATLAAAERAEHGNHNKRNPNQKPNPYRDEAKNEMQDVIGFLFFKQAVLTAVFAVSADFRYGHF
jgi:hypothetical protein